MNTETVETEQELVEWVKMTLANPDASEEDKAEALRLVDAVDESLDTFTERWLAIQDIEDDDERARAEAAYEAELEAE